MPQPSVDRKDQILQISLSKIGGGGVLRPLDPPLILCSRYHIYLPVYMNEDPGQPRTLSREVAETGLSGQNFHTRTSDVCSPCASRDGRGS